MPPNWERGILGRFAQFHNQKNPSLKDIAFIDLEASGLSARSWPIEVGWCLAEGDACSFLIKPDADWTLEDWSKEAEALHGLPHDLLLRDGNAPEEVCQKLNDALMGKLVYSDAPDWDSFWLYRLFQSAKTRQSFVVQDLSKLFRTAPPEKLDSIIAAAELKAPRNHRAAADALHLRVLYQLITA